MYAQVVQIFTELAQFNPDSFVHVKDHLPANYVLVIDEAGVLPRIGEFLDKFSPYVLLFPLRPSRQENHQHLERSHCGLRFDKLWILIRHLLVRFTMLID